MPYLVPSQQNSVQVTAISRELDEHLQRMEQAAQVAKVGIQELSEIYTYSEFKAINSLVAADLCRKSFLQAGGTLTAAEEQAYMTLRQQYLEQMSQISQIASGQIIRDVAHAPRALAPRGLINVLFGD